MKYYKDNKKFDPTDIDLKSKILNLMNLIFKFEFNYADSKSNPIFKILSKFEI